MNGLEIANKRIKEKELLTSAIFLELALEIAAITEIFSQNHLGSRQRRDIGIFCP